MIGPIIDMARIDNTTATSPNLNVSAISCESEVSGGVTNTVAASEIMPHTVIIAGTCQSKCAHVRFIG
ncbi:hypothetical protein GCM10009615_11470 [Corynebacterium durum]